jgi:MFS family permease
VVIASIGTWGQMVGAQWLFVNDPNAATIVPLVQTASTLPMMLLALPAGVLADAFDRRWMMFVIQVYFITVSTLLAILTALGRMPPRRCCSHSPSRSGPGRPCCHRPGRP